MRIVPSTAPAPEPGEPDSYIVPILDAGGSLDVLSMAEDVVEAAGIEAWGLTTFRAWLHVREEDEMAARAVLSRDTRTRPFVLTDDEMARLRRGDHPIRRPAEAKRSEPRREDAPLVATDRVLLLEAEQPRDASLLLAGDGRAQLLLSGLAGETESLHGRWRRDGGGAVAVSYDWIERENLITDGPIVGKALAPPESQVLRATGPRSYEIVKSTLPLERRWNVVGDPFPIPRGLRRRPAAVEAHDEQGATRSK